MDIPNGRAARRLERFERESALLNGAVSDVNPDPGANWRALYELKCEEVTDLEQALADERHRRIMAEGALAGNRGIDLPTGPAVAAEAPSDHDCAKESGVEFPDEARALSPLEVRALYPRKRCPKCDAICYASYMHYIAGDW